MTFNGTLGEKKKTRWELYDLPSCALLKKNLKAASYKTTAGRPLTSHLRNNSKTNKKFWARLSKYSRSHKTHSSMDLFIWTQQCSQSAKTYIHHLCMNIRWCLKNSPKLVTYMDRQTDRQIDREIDRQKLFCRYTLMIIIIEGGVIIHIEFEI